MLSKKRGIEKGGSVKSQKGGGIAEPPQLSPEYCELIRANSSIGQKGFTVLKALMDESDLKYCRAALSLQKELDAKCPVAQENPPILMYRENTKKIYMPRYWCADRYGGFPPAINIKLNPQSISTETNLVFQGTLRENQAIVCNKYLNHVAGNPGCAGGLLSMFCAGGKTVLAINIATRLRQRALIIVHKTFLANQWKERINQFSKREDGSPSTVGFVQGDRFEVDGCDFVICMLQTLYSRDFPENAFSSIGIMIVDETHRICSEQFSKALFKIGTPYTLGISATMNRKDGMEKIIKMSLGPVLHEEERNGGDDPISVRSIEFRPAVANPEYEEDILDFRGKIQYSSMMNKICVNEERMEFIYRVVSDLRKEDPNKQIMVLSFTKAILQFLQRRITGDGDFVGTCGFYVGGMKEKDLAETEKQDVVLATYSMAAEALDIPTLSSLVMATPKTDIIQSVGRILRRKHENPLIVDIVDVHRVFKNQYRSRHKYYKQCDYAVYSVHSKDYSGFVGVDWGNLKNTGWKCTNSRKSVGDARDSDCDYSDSESPLSKKVCLI
jgi:superfamily II DNA or RNA helicase